MGKIFPGKVLLFGEYTLLYNQRSLAIPFAKYHGKWSFDLGKNAVPELGTWGQWLGNLSNRESWLTTQAIKNFNADIEQGIWFDANIPLGYGLGSSGALVAAWYDRYINIDNKISPLDLKKRLAFLESFFHGTSSGFDPLVSYLQTTILQDKQGINTIPNLNQIPLLKKCFLLDTGIPRSTEPLVKLFKEKSKTAPFKNEILPQLVKAQSNAMDAFILSDLPLLESAFFTISTLQFNFLKELIPVEIQNIWKAGLESRQYLLKLCGAGGGGCMLGLGKLSSAEFPVINLID